MRNEELTVASGFQQHSEEAYHTLSATFRNLFCRNIMSLIHGLNQTVRYGEDMEWRGDSREYSSVGSFMG
jgi:hypothetical protein